MKKVLLSVVSICLYCFSFAQQTGQNNRDSLIREKLVALAMNNPALRVADANIKIAELGLKKSKATWLSSLAVGGNVNEFVITNSSAASFFPKYNFGVSVPLDIFSRSAYEKKTSEQAIIIGHEMKQTRIREIRTEVLTRYELYKEKRELVRLQKISMEPDYQAYIAAQKSYEDGNIKIDEMNKVYQVYINEQAKLVTREKDYNVAVVQLEELIAVTIGEALKEFPEAK